jgi:hypothetical protein
MKNPFGSFTSQLYSGGNNLVERTRNRETEDVAKNKKVSGFTSRGIQRQSFFKVCETITCLIRELCMKDLYVALKLGVTIYERKVPRKGTTALRAFVLVAAPLNSLAL